MMCAGETCVALFPSDVPEPQRVNERETLSLRHIAFRVDGENFEAAQRRCRDLGIEFESADHGIAQSVYISDPDGHRIEITTYEV